MLRYLPTNLSAPEIASELYVSPNTVKTHIRHLYAKLGTHRRAEAVERARALGLLAPFERRRRPAKRPRAAGDLNPAPAEERLTLDRRPRGWRQSARPPGGSRYPTRSPRAVFGIVTILSQFTTESWPSPLARPTGISMDRPRAVEVTGATVTCVRCGMTISRVRTRTGRALSRCATWMASLARVHGVAGEVLHKVNHVGILA